MGQMPGDLKHLFLATDDRDQAASSGGDFCLAFRLLRQEGTAPTCGVSPASSSANSEISFWVFLFIDAQMD